MGPGPDQGVRRARERARLFRGLGDPSRLALLDALRTGPLSVGDLAGAAGLTQPNTSNHLARLAADGLVRSRRRGRHVIYELADPRVGALLDLAAALGAWSA